MRFDLANLPSDIDLLHRLVRDMAAVVETRDDEIERLQRLIKQLQRTQFGRRSERLDRCWRRGRLERFLNCLSFQTVL
jgi:hypothetical protein